MPENSLLEKEYLSVIGSSRPARMFLVPGDSVNSLFSVRSRRQEVSSRLASRLTAMSRINASSTPPPVEYRFATSARLPVLDDQRVGVQPEGDQGREIHDVAHVQHALLDGFEVGDEAEGADHVHDRLRRPAAEKVQHDARAAEDEAEADHDRHHEG